MRTGIVIAVVVPVLSWMLVSAGCGSLGGSAPSHPAVGHWMGTVERADGSTVFSSMLVDADESPLRVALTLLPTGAFYSDCIDVATSDQTLDYRLKKGKFDITFHASLSADGKEMTGTYSVPEGSRPEFQSGNFQYTKTPRAKDLPNAMRFARTLSDDTGPYTPNILLAETDDGRWVGQFDIPERSFVDMPIHNLREEDGVIKGDLHVAGPMMVFTLMLSEDRQNLSGTWVTGNITVDLDLPRVD